MKALIGLALLLTFAAPSFADDMPLNSIDIGLGAAIPTSANDFNQIAGQGAELSLEYYRRVAPAFDLGLGVTGFGFADKTVTTPVFTSNVQTSASAVSIRSRFFPWPDSRFSPYLIGGVGISGYSEKADTTPNPGFVWSNTGTRETRRTLDASSNGFASQLGLGIMANFTRRFYGAVEGDWHLLTTDKDKFGASNIQVIEAGAKVGWRF